MVLRVLAPHGEPRPAAAPAHAGATAEHVAEEIAERADILEARRGVILRALGPAGIFAVIALLRPLLAARIDLAAVVFSALLGILEDRIGVGDLLELLLGRRVAGIEIGVQLLGELAVGLGNVVGARGLRHAKNGIEILCHRPI